MIAWLISGLASADDYQPLNTQPPDDGPLPAELAIQKIHLPDGFQLTLAAAEPSVRQPIAITFDDRGRLWVAESYSYDGSTFTDSADDRILIFEDTTGDGVLDKRKIFCDGLNRLTGLAIGFGGIWITAPPFLSFIPDRNQDDLPDSAAIPLLDGWSVTAEHNSVNGLSWGPDGWLYGRHGIKQPSLVGHVGDQNKNRLKISCGIWRYHPIRCEFEIVADGTINPWGLDFDDHGQGFMTTSVVEHLWHLIPGAHYQRWKDREVHPNRFVYETMTATSDHLHWRSGNWDRSGRQARGNQSFGGGHSHCDAMIYLGDRWPAAYRGLLMTSNIHGRRINCDQLIRAQGVYRGVHKEDFLVSEDPWFRAVSMEYGPDGDVYLSDWSDNGECHDRDGVHRTSGRIYKISWGKPRRVEVDLGNASGRDLVDYQLHRNDWYVRHARRILQERAAAGEDLSTEVADLRKMFSDHNDITRKLRALWTLYAIGGLDHDWLVSQLKHRDEHIRAWSARLLCDGSTPTQSTLNSLAERAYSDPSWLVRMTLASVLNRVPLEGRWAIAIPLARDRHFWAQANLQRMIWYAIEPAIAANPRRAANQLTSVSPRIRRWIARRLSEQSPRGIELLFAEIQNSHQPEPVSEMLHGFNDALEMVEVDQISDSTKQTLAKLIENEASMVRIPALTALAAVGDAPMLESLRELLHSSSPDQETRRAALIGLIQRKTSSLPQDLVRLLEANRLTSTVLKSAATVEDQTLSQTLVSLYSTWDQSNRRLAIQALVSRRASALALIDAIEAKRIPPSDLTAAQIRQIRALKDDELTDRFEAFWGSVRPTSTERLKQIKSIQSNLTPVKLSEASLENGRLLYQNRCATCHELFGEGKSLGPSLTGANRQDVFYLLSNVIDPSAAVPADYQLSVAVTNDGRIIIGTVVNQTDATIRLQTIDNSVELQRSEIESFKTTKNSFMPEGLLEYMNESEVRDLIAWIMSNGPDEISSDQESHKEQARVVLLGDSIRMGYEKEVAKLLHPRATVWSPDENGRDTVHTLAELSNWLETRQPDVLHLNVGLHDMLLMKSTNLPRHSLETYADNLRKIFSRIQELTDAEIIFATTTPVDEQRQVASKTYGRVVRRNEDVERYNAIATKIAREYDVHINELNHLANQNGVKNFLRDDGVHLSKSGNITAARHIAEVIRGILDADHKQADSPLHVESK